MDHQDTLASRADPPPLRILLVATMRNEGPFILEWLAYHRAIGFTDVVVCSNDCVDGSPAMLHRLQQLGLLTHLPIDVRRGEKPQLTAYARAEAAPVVGEADWVMVLDADEFLNVHTGIGRVTDLIAAVPDATAFLVNWRLFGSAGHRAFQQGFVTERFTRAAQLEHGVNWSFKTLFRGIDAYGCKLLPHQPRFPHADRLGALRYVDGAGRVLPRYFCDESRGDFLQSEPGQVSWALAQVNHYNTRAWEDYLVKHSRGGGLDIAWDREASWAVFNRNEQADLSIAPKLPATKRLVAEWLEDDELRHLHGRCCRLYCDHVAALRGTVEGANGSSAG